MADVMMGFSGTQCLPALTEEEIRKRCPLAYATVPTNDRVSDKYVLANTSTVIADMAKLGWQVVNAKQRKAQKDSSGRFSYHMIALQNPDIKITKERDGEETVEAFPQIIVTNSHDGLNCFQLHCGLYRCICSNGLIISDLSLAEFKIRHIYYSFEALRDLINRFVGSLESYVGRISNMASVILTDEQKQEFARQVLGIRKNISIDELNVDQETIDDILTPVRKEDEGDSLWNVYNVLQEKATKGGYSEAREDGKKARRVRKITSFIKDMEISRKIDEVAKSYLSAVA